MAGASREGKLITIDKLGKRRLSEPGCMIAHIGNEENVIRDAAVLDELDKLIFKFPAVGDEALNSSSPAASPGNDNNDTNSQSGASVTHGGTTGSPTSPSSSSYTGAFGFMKSVTSATSNATSSLKSWVFSSKK